MESIIKDRLEEVVALMNNPEQTVLNKELKEKLEKIIVLLDKPEDIAIEKEELEGKLNQVVGLVQNATVDPDIDVEYFGSDAEDEPYLLVTYVVGEYNKPTRKIRLRQTVLRRNTALEIANQVTFSIGEFKGEIDSVEMG